jgi:hypothetical protein
MASPEYSTNEADNATRHCDRGVPMADLHTDASAKSTALTSEVAAALNCVPQGDSGRSHCAAYRSQRNAEALQG